MLSAKEISPSLETYPEATDVETAVVVDTKAAVILSAMVTLTEVPG
jgi:hypothetical protein